MVVFIVEPAAILAELLTIVATILILILIFVMVLQQRNGVDSEHAPRGAAQSKDVAGAVGRAHRQVSRFLDAAVSTRVHSRARAALDVCGCGKEQGDAPNVPDGDTGTSWLRHELRQTHAQVHQAPRRQLLSNQGELKSRQLPADLPACGRVLLHRQPHRLIILFFEQRGAIDRGGRWKGLVKCWGCCS